MKSAVLALIMVVYLAHGILPHHHEANGQVHYDLETFSHHHHHHHHSYAGIGFDHFTTCEEDGTGHHHHNATEVCKETVVETKPFLKLKSKSACHLCWPVTQHESPAPQLPAYHDLLKLAWNEPLLRVGAGRAPPAA